MIDVDVILCQPRHVDYPLFRYRMNQWKDYFHKIFVGVTQGAFNEDYIDFIRGEMPYAQFEFAPPVHQDWRQNAIANILNNFSEADYVLFLEQDFLIKDLYGVFWKNVLNTGWKSDFIFYNEDTRFHPAFYLVSRELIDKTDKEFSAQPPKYDHFGLFTDQLLQQAQYGMRLEAFGFENRKDFYHMAGLTQNYSCVKRGEPLYKPKEFLAYNTLTMGLPRLHPGLLQEYKRIQSEYGNGDEDGFLQNFFPKISEIN